MLVPGRMAGACAPGSRCSTKPAAGPASSRATIRADISAMGSLALMKRESSAGAYLIHPRPTRRAGRVQLSRASTTVLICWSRQRSMSKGATFAGDDGLTTPDATRSTKANMRSRGLSSSRAAPVANAGDHCYRTPNAFIGRSASQARWRRIRRRSWPAPHSSAWIASACWPRRPARVRISTGSQQIMSKCLSFTPPARSPEAAAPQAAHWPRLRGRRAPSGHRHERRCGSQGFGHDRGCRSPAYRYGQADGEFYNERPEGDRQRQK